MIKYLAVLCAVLAVACAGVAVLPYAYAGYPGHASVAVNRVGGNYAYSVNDAPTVYAAAYPYRYGYYPNNYGYGYAYNY